MVSKDRFGKLKKIIGSEGYEEIARSLVLVEDFLEKEFAGKAPGEFKEELLRVIKAGGKRVRPLLVIICGRLNEFRIPEIIRAAACVEAVHTASLIHDDVIDNANFRRGSETTYKRYGVDFAVKAGDYLFAKSFELLSELKNENVVLSLANASEDLSLGELDGSLLRWSVNTSVEEYFQWISRKTASLFKASCEIGAMVSNAPDYQVKAVSEFGYYLGVAFQLFDDLLDATGTSEILGKPAGSDLKEGYLTLPYLLALKDLHYKDRIEKVLKKKLSAEEIQTLVEEIASSEYVLISREYAVEMVERASKCLEGLANESVKHHLLSVADYVIQRYY